MAVTGCQFDSLFGDHLNRRIAKNAKEKMTGAVARGGKERGCTSPSEFPSSTPASRLWRD